MESIELILVYVSKKVVIFSKKQCRNRFTKFDLVMQIMSRNFGYTSANPSQGVSAAFVCGCGFYRPMNEKKLQTTHALRPNCWSNANFSQQFLTPTTQEIIHIYSRMGSLYLASMPNVDPTGIELQVEATQFAHGLCNDATLPLMHLLTYLHPISHESMTFCNRHLHVNPLRARDRRRTYSTSPTESTTVGPNFAYQPPRQQIIVG